MIPETPAALDVRLVCPECKQALQVQYEVTAQLTVTTDADGITEKVLKPRFKAQQVAHQCHQMTIDQLTGEVLS